MDLNVKTQTIILIEEKIENFCNPEGRDFLCWTCIYKRRKNVPDKLDFIKM